jgi:hypothetical protein
VHPSLNSSVSVDCPWCGETIELLIDLGGGNVQNYIEDCEVCCRPWDVSVAFNSTSGISATLEPSD